MGYVDTNKHRGIARRIDIDAPIGGAAKRGFDILAALAGLIMLFPLLLACVLAIRLSSRGPILFSHQRIGFGGRPFYCLKFRTMVVDAEARLREYLGDNPEARREWERSHKLQHDPRVTKLGTLLRQTSLDEFPQLINVLRGDMSLVGPRPIVRGEIGRYQEHFSIYVRCRPGLTGLWQIRGRNNTTYAERIAYDVAYARNWSPLADFKILLLTIPRCIDRHGAY
jgi:exopolysaccharide production protein ExoY